MGENKLATLVVRLLEKTRQGKLSWERTVDEGVYQAAFADYAVRILTLYERGAPEPDIVLRIFDKEGVLIEQTSDLELSSSGIQAYRVMSETYNLARRQALGVDRAVDTLLAELE